MIDIILLTLKIALSFVPLITVIYLFRAFTKPKSYKMLNFESKEECEVFICEDVIKSKLLNKESVLMEDTKQCKKIIRIMSKYGYLTHIHFSNINGESMLVLSLSKSRFKHKEVYLGEDYKFN